MIFIDKDHLTLYPILSFRLNRMVWLRDVVIDDSNVIMNLHNEFVDDSILNSNFNNQNIKFSYIKDSIQYNHVIPRETNVDGVEKHIYRFLNAGITLTLWSKIYPVAFGPQPMYFMRIDVDKYPLKQNIVIKVGTQGDHVDYDYLIENLKRIYEIHIRSVGRNLVSVQRVGKNRNLPHNIEAVTAGFLTGINKTSIKGQQNKLQQQLGISLAPRARKTRKHRR
jgi:hypothetical protein